MTPITLKLGEVQAQLAVPVRQELADSLDGSLEEAMGTLRGRSWSL